ncbi:hypothetical protein GF322_03845 [Candidatus Dependentiae bacterium]|nr:hypothetical protein [Candidatus Dependentiae bacterium]
MKNLFFLIFIFFKFNLFSYPQAELGLISNYNEPEKRIQHRFVQQKKIDLIKEKRKDGSDSFVVRVENLPQFLFLSTMQQKPLIVGFFVNKNEAFYKYQDVADKLKDLAVFVVIDKQQSPALINLFNVVLKFEGISLDLINGKENYPFFLFCDSDFVFLQSNTINFRKNGINLLGKPGSCLMTKLIKDIKVNINQIALNDEKETKKTKNMKEKSSFWHNFKDKLKSWFQTYIKK